MNKLLLLCLVLSSTATFAQPNTEVYLLDINVKNSKIILSNLRNISNNEGYDNQPSFYDDNSVLFSSTRNSQTDIAKYNIETGQLKWLTDTPGGSEFSPLRIPGLNDLSFIRLDNNGLQRLYRYNIAKGKSEELLKDFKVGYHVWYNEHIVACTVLVDDRMDLVVSNLKDSTNYTVQKNVGRSLQKIPNSNLISYISKGNEEWSIKSLNPISGATENITRLPANLEDFCWLMTGEILMAEENDIYRFDPKNGGEWLLVKSYENEDLQKITRLASNNANDKLALVAE